jgi:hypothetical protein
MLVAASSVVRARFPATATHLTRYASFMTTRIAIATALLVFAPLLAKANTELTVKSERSSVPVKGMQTLNGDKQPPANQTIHLTLGARWIEWADGISRGVYDFAKHVILDVDPQTRHLVELSM